MKIKITQEWKIQILKPVLQASDINEKEKRQGTLIFFYCWISSDCFLLSRVDIPRGKSKHEWVKILYFFLPNCILENYIAGRQASTQTHFFYFLLLLSLPLPLRTIQCFHTNNTLFPAAISYRNVIHPAVYYFFASEERRKSQSQSGCHKTMSIFYIIL